MTLSINVGLVLVMLKVFVVDVPSPYNIILGKIWTPKMKFVPFTCHEKMMFPIV